MADRPTVVHGYEVTDDDVVVGEDLVLVGGNLPYYRGYFLAELEFDDGCQELIAAGPPWTDLRTYLEDHLA